VINFPNNPILGDAFSHGGTIYTCVLINPVVWNAAPGAAAIPEAPLDGLVYGRREAAWKALDKADVGLGNVDNTADINKPVSGPQQAALNGKEAVIAMGGVAQYWRGDKTWQVLNAAAAGAVAKTGDTMTGSLSIADPVNAESRFVLQSKDTNLSYPIIYGYRGANVRWAIIPGTGINETGGNVGGDFNIQRYADNGAYLGTALTISRASGAMDVYGRIGCNGDIATSNGSLSVTGSVSAANGMGFALNGGATYNILGMGYGLGGAYALLWNRGNGNFSFTNSGGGGTVEFGTDGRITTIGGTALWINGTVSDGSTYSLVSQVVSNPAWGTLDFRSRHQYGQWAGYEFITGGTQVRFTMSNGQGWGSIQAISFDVQSDATTKQAVLSVSSALEMIDGIQAHTYEYIPVEPKANEDGTFPAIYGKKRYAGTMAQDWLDRLPEAVTETDGNLMLDYAAIGAVTAQAVSELLQRVKALEVEIATLKGA
jgi:hypothetical protein